MRKLISSIFFPPLQNELFQLFIYWIVRFLSVILHVIMDTCSEITPTWRMIALSVFPLPCSRLRTSCMTWYRTWMREERTWRRGLPCWKQSWRLYWVTCRHCQDSSVRSSASSTGTSWRCSCSLMTNTALSAHSQCPDGGRPPQHRPPPPRAARVQGKCLHWRLLPSYGQVAFIVKPYGFNKYYPNSGDRIQDTGDSAF